MRTQTIDVTLEAFGNKKITAQILPEDMIGKTVEDLIKGILSQPHTNEERQTQIILQREMSASGGYSAQLGTSGDNLPVRYQPIALNSSVKDYLDRRTSETSPLKITITGNHRVGYNEKI